MTGRKLKLLMATLIVACPVYAQFTGDGFKNLVVGSRHDLTSNNPDPDFPGTTATGATAVCEFCHAPHKTAANPPASNGAGGSPQPPLLWNVQVKPGPYAVYGGSSTFAATDVRDPSTAGPTKHAAYMSLLCLSCHDGAITTASFYFT